MTTTNTATSTTIIANDNTIFNSMHTDYDIEELKLSISEVGYTRPIVDLKHGDYKKSNANKPLTKKQLMKKTQHGGIPGLS